MTNYWNINKSYVFSPDSDYESGRRYFFTFFSQFGSRSTSLIAIEVFFLLVMKLTGFSLNIFHFAVLWKHRKPASVSIILEMNLCFSSLLGCLSFILIILTRTFRRWVFHQFFCSFLVFGMFLCYCFTAWILTAIVVDRSRYIRRKMGGRLPLSFKWSKRMVSIIWLMGVIGTSPMGIFFRNRSFTVNGEEVSICTLLWPKTAIGVSIFIVALTVFITMVLPLIIITYSYVRIINVLKKLRRRNRDILTEFQQVQHMKEKIMAKLLLAMVICFFLTWIPIFALFFLLLFDSVTQKLITTSTMMLVTTVIALSNCITIPLIYGSLTGKFKLKSLTGLIQFITSKLRNFRNDSRKISNVASRSNT